MKGLLLSGALFLFEALAWVIDVVGDIAFVAGLFFGAAACLALGVAVAVILATAGLALGASVLVMTGCESLVSAARRPIRALRLQNGRAA